MSTQPKPTPRDQGPPFIPDEAIQKSEELKHQPKARPKIAMPKTDAYNEERVATDNPSSDEVKNSIPDDNVKPG